jgi:hypothetical protein
MGSTALSETEANSYSRTRQKKKIKHAVYQLCTYKICIGDIKITTLERNYMK